MKKNYEVNLPSFNGDDWKAYDALDAEDAAQKFAEYYDEGDHCLINHHAFVRVREIGTEEITLCYISAEPSIDYSSNEVTQHLCRKCKKDMVPELLEKGVCGYSYDDSFCSKECYRGYYHLDERSAE